MTNKEPLKIFIGYDPREAVVYHTCVQSIIENTKSPVSIHPLHLDMFEDYKEEHKDGSNAFIYSRFLVPYLSNFRGKALFIDGDMIVNKDLNELFNLFDKNYAVQVVKHEYKTKFPTKYLGSRNDDYPKKNWSSVILFNCEHEKNKILIPSFVEKAVGSYLHRFSWLKDKEVGSLPLEWNYLVLEYKENQNASLLHYTIGAPCFSDYNKGKEAKVWQKMYFNSISGFDDLNKFKNSL